jgi:Resolvase, N terminal domain
LRSAPASARRRCETLTSGLLWPAAGLPIGRPGRRRVLGGRTGFGPCASDHRAEWTKADRLTRSVGFLSILLDAGVDVRFEDLPQIEGTAGRFMLKQMALVAELEAGFISDRTKASLARRQTPWQEAGRLPRWCQAYRTTGQKWRGRTCRGGLRGDCAGI